MAKQLRYGNPVEKWVGWEMFCVCPCLGSNQLIRIGNVMTDAEKANSRLLVYNIRLRNDALSCQRIQT